MSGGHRMLSPMEAVPDASSPLTHGFLLIEPATLVHTPFLQTLSLHSCTPRVLAHREELMPKLLDVASLEPDAQAQVTDIWLEETETDRPPVVCAWIDSPLTMDELASHVKLYLVGPSANGNPVFWRYYDPRVLSLTLAVFDHAQRQALVRPATVWQFAWAGHRWNAAGPGAPADETQGYVPAWPRPDQWPRIDRSDIAIRVIDSLPTMPADEAVRLPAELDRILSGAASRGGPTGADDLVDYARHCLQYGVAFEQHPKLIDAWPALARREMSWPEAKARLTPEDFKLLKNNQRSLLA